jgi:hypothetical protein
MNSIAYAISSSIKEGKWLSVTYDNPNEGRDTSFWCSIRDIDAKTHTLKVDMFNSTKSLDALINKTIHYERIKSADLITFSSFDTPEALIQKLENHPQDFAWLHYENFNNDILRYLDECNRLDNDPYQKHYAMVEGIDLSVLKTQKAVALSPEQIDQIVKAIYFNDLTKIDTASNELALSVLSVDENNKKYVVAYYTVCFNPSTKTLALCGSLKFNKTFIIEEHRHSLSQYLDIDPDEFIEGFQKDPVTYTNLLKEGFDHGEQVDTRPDLMILERDMEVSLSRLFEIVEEKRWKGTLNVPMKAFFGDISLRNNGKKEPVIVVYDHQVNIDQVRVIYNAMKNPVTYVQGPPGTGKTQTIFNVLVSAFFADKKVLVCSMNNKPVDGLLKKLSFTYVTKSGGRNEVPFPLLRLGKKEYVITATLKIRDYMDHPFGGKPDLSRIESIKNYEALRNKNLVGLLTQYEQRKVIEDNIAAANKLLTHLKPNDRFAEPIKRQIAAMTEELDKHRLITNEEVLGMLACASDSHSYMQYLYYASLERVQKLQQPRYKELSEIVHLADDDERYKKFNGWIASDANIKLLTDAFPLIFSTNISSSHLGSAEGFMFDLVIMDEAGQCDIAKSLLPIARGNSLLLVGDPDQLQPVVLLDPSINERLKAKYQIGSTYDYAEKSILSLMSGNDRVSKHILLSYHYRCGRRIIGFSNQYFYHQSLKLQTANGEGSVLLNKVTNFFKAPRKNVSLDEAEAVVKYVKRNAVKDTVIITPFKNQEATINALLTQEGISDVKACTIHSVQGAEASCVILSPSVNRYTSKETFKWLAKHKEIANVAVTRGQNKLVIFADPEAIDKVSTGDNVWKQLVRYAASNGQVAVVPPENLTADIGKSHASTAEDEFYKTMAQFCSVYRKYHVARNVKLATLFPNNPDFASSKQEFDSVIYARAGFLGRMLPVLAFEVSGGEHFGDAYREALDKKKRELSQKIGLKIVIIDNNSVKDYEFIRELMCSMNNEEAVQMSLFA